jgi:probable rRNA maturation factor
MNIVIVNRQRTKKINARLLKQIVSQLLAELEVKEAELGINLVGEREMTLVNETFLQHEGSTDVITFDHAENVAQASRLRNLSSKRKMPGRDACAALHGELFVCVDEAILQAKQFDTNWQSEVVRYIVHGVLHLLGHDDRRSAARRRMKRVENRLVRHLEKRFSPTNSFFKLCQNKD